MFNNAWHKAEEFWCLFALGNLSNSPAYPGSAFFFFFSFKMPLKVQTSVQHVNYLDPRRQLSCKALSIHIYFMKSTHLCFSCKNLRPVGFFTPE